MDDDLPANPTDTNWAAGCTFVQYDEAGRRAFTINELGHRTDYGYDEAGRQIGVLGPDPDLGNSTDTDRPESLTHYDSHGWVDWRRDPRGVYTVFAHDDAGQTIDQWLARDDNSNDVIDEGEKHEHRQFTFDPGGQKVAETDALDRTTGCGHDEVGRLTSVTDALSHVTSYVYDPSGNMTEQHDALDRVTHYEYDAATGRRTARVLPLGQRETFEYTLSGQPLHHVDFNGKTTTNEYDAFDRLTTVDHQTSPDFAFTYYPGGRRLTATVAGQGTTTYEYEGIPDPDTEDIAFEGHSRGWLARVTNPKGWKLSYAHDDGGNVSARTTTVGSETHATGYAFDDAGRLASVFEASVEQAHYDYGVGGPVSTLTYPTIGVHATYEPDIAGRQQAIKWYKGSETTPFKEFDWTINEAGQRTQVDEADGRRVEYGYDELDRLRDETYRDSPMGSPVHTVHYDYDAVGNRLHRTASGPTEDLSYTYDDDDRMLTAGSDGYGYDDNGNTTTLNGEALYDWDEENRLVAAHPSTGDLEFEYDADGLRQATTVVGVMTTREIVDTSFPYAQVLEERSDATDALTGRFLRGAQLLRQDVGSESSWFVHDHLGSTRALFSGGDVTESLDYEGFGALLEGGGDPGTEWRFTGGAVAARDGTGIPAISVDGIWRRVVLIGRHAGWRRHARQ